MKKTYKTKNAAETAKVARAFAATLKGGETIALVGNLGAGKTTFVQALAKALGVKERVTSPTFVYMHVHRLPRSIVNGQLSKALQFAHVDAYRGDAASLRGIGLEEYIDDPESTVVIEWADRAEAILPKGTIFIRFSHAGGDAREIGIES